MQKRRECRALPERGAAHLNSTDDPNAVAVETEIALCYKTIQGKTPPKIPRIAHQAANLSICSVEFPINAHLATRVL